jgi:protein SCO1/2
MLEQLTRTFSDSSLKLGQEFTAVTVSVDPRETPVLAAKKKQEIVGLATQPGAEQGWHFLTGDQSTIARLAQAIGFQYNYDAKEDEYAHPLGIVVLTPQGRIARYLSGLDYSPRDLRLALVEASQNKIGSPIDQILLFCFHYDPATGKYTTWALDVARWGGLATAVVWGLFLGLLWRKELVKRKA